MLNPMAAGLMQTNANRRHPGTTAFVLAGGAALASIQVGTVRPRRVVGALSAVAAELARWAPNRADRRLMADA